MWQEVKSVELNIYTFEFAIRSFLKTFDALRRNTRSSSYTMPLLNRPAYSKATLGDRSFSSSVWNSIPNDVRCAPSLSSFKSRWRHTCFVQFTKTELYFWSLYICVWLGLVIALLMVFLKNALMCKRKVKLINHDCLPILMLLYIMLAYLMLFAALSIAVCLYNAFLVFFLLLIFANAFCYHALSWNIDT